MSRKRSSNVNRTNGYHARETLIGDRRRGDQIEEESTMKETHTPQNSQVMKDQAYKQANKQPDSRRLTDEVKHEGIGLDPEFERLCNALDDSAVGTSMIISDLFKVVSMAATLLPNIEIHTEAFSVIVDNDSIIVCVTGLNPDANDDHREKLSKDHRGYEKGNVPGCNHRYDCGYEEDDWNPEEDDEEEKVYDEY